MNIGIVGLGLIGGSLGLDLRSRGYQVLGVSRQEHTCQRAIARGAVDDASVNLTLLAAADVVFICTPLSAIESTVIQLIPHLAATTILTDVGSVKTSVVESITPLWPNFVGGHPMAGTAENGIEAAQANLFASKPYVLTPTTTTPPVCIETVETLVRSLNAHLYHCRPEDHDRAVAWISHLPVMASSSLIAACMSETDPTTLELAQALASSGFKDTSRVGGGNPELGLMMARYNRSALLRSLSAYRNQLDQIIANIEQENWEGVADQLHQTQQARSQFVN
uniref:prephenate/arogenate dehydrogenase n=1 Tax=Trichocoleus desertorum TaxID=1481672 RepID=UPI0025B4AC1F|nr:prephenate/arogenate dehydrogenase [Trichocoleus desertorum]